VSNVQLTEAWNMASCAQANLENLANQVPALRQFPMFKVVKYQLEETLKVLSGEGAEPTQLELPLEVPDVGE